MWWQRMPNWGFRSCDRCFSMTRILASIPSRMPTCWVRISMLLRCSSQAAVSERSIFPRESGYILLRKHPMQVESIRYRHPWGSLLSSIDQAVSSLLSFRPCSIQERNSLFECCAGNEDLDELYALFLHHVEDGVECVLCQGVEATGFLCLLGRKV